jgi:hypothetical protein
MVYGEARKRGKNATQSSPTSIPAAESILCCKVRGIFVALGVFSNRPGRGAHELFTSSSPAANRVSSARKDSPVAG